MSFKPESSVLLIIDMQQRLLPAIREVDAVIANIERLAGIARLLDVPVLATEQSPSRIGSNVAAIASLTDATLEKTHFDATREPHWPDFLPNGRTDLIVTGCEAHVCVLQSVLGLRARGHRVRLVRDAVGSRLTANRDAALHRAERYGAELVTCEMVAFEWLGHAEHTKFRDALKLIK